MFGIVRRMLGTTTVMVIRTTTTCIIATGLSRNLAYLMELFELRQAYYSARKYKRRKDDSLEFEIQAEMHLVELLDCINS